jgi:hypothetical protein
MCYHCRESRQINRIQKKAVKTGNIKALCKLIEYLRNSRLNYAEDACWYKAKFEEVARIPDIKEMGNKQTCPECKTEIYDKNRRCSLSSV